MNNFILIVNDSTIEAEVISREPLRLIIQLGDEKYSVMIIDSEFNIAPQYSTLPITGAKRDYLIGIYYLMKYQLAKYDVSF